MGFSLNPTDLIAALTKLSIAQSNPMDTDATTPIDIDMEITPFNDRSVETRNVRTASALQALDEDTPMDLDDSISNLLENNTNITTSTPGSMDYIVSDSYLDFKEALAEKKAKSPPLPKSKTFEARQRQKLNRQ